MKIMFVCLGNICRSPLAHGIFQHLINEQGLGSSYSLESSGTGAYHLGEQADSPMRATAKSHGILVDHKARQIYHYDLRDYNLILVMDKCNLESVRSLSGSERLLKKVRLFRDFDPKGSGDVPDPYYGGTDGFENVFQIVNRTSKALLEQLERTGVCATLYPGSNCLRETRGER